MVLNLCTSSDDALYLYQVSRKHLKGFHSYQEDAVCILKFSKGHNSVDSGWSRAREIVGFAGSGPIFETENRFISRQEAKQLVHKTLFLKILQYTDLHCHLSELFTPNKPLLLVIILHNCGRK